MMVIFGQLVGFTAFLIFIKSLQKKEKRDILLIQVVAFFLYTLQYFLIGAFSGMIVFFINMLRSFAFYVCEIKGKNTNMLFIIFIFITAICCSTSINYLYDIFPLIATMGSVIIMWQQSTKIIRIGQIFICIQWIIYDIFVFAYVGIITESIVIIESIITLLKNNYNLKIEEIFLRRYIIFRYEANRDIVKLSNDLPTIRKNRMFYIRSYINRLLKEIYKIKEKLKMKERN